MNEPIHNNSKVFVPAAVLQHPALNPALIYTWMKIKLLIGNQEESAPIGVHELVEYIGKSASTLYGHIAVLKRVELVHQRCEARGKLIFSFPPEVHSEKLDQKTGIQSRKLENLPSPSPEIWNKNGHKDENATLTDQDSDNLESVPENWKTIPTSFQKIGVDSEKLENGKSFDSRKLESTPENWKTPPTSVQKTGLQSGNLESSPENWNRAPASIQKTGVNSEKLENEVQIDSEKLESSPENWNHALSLKPLINNNNLNINQEEVLREAQFQKTVSGSGNLEKEAVKAYHATLGLRPNKAQREAIGEEVKDLELWQATLDHWQLHRWNPKNILGILEIYARDGPEGLPILPER